MPRLELGVIPRGSDKATAFSCRKNESSSKRELWCEPEQAGFNPAGRPHDLRSGELSYFNMWGCIQLARRNTCPFVTAANVGGLRRNGGAGASACGGTASSVGRFDRIFRVRRQWPTTVWQPNFTQR